MNYCEEENLNKVKLVDVETGKPTENVEWLATEYNGKLLVNVANYNYYGDYKYFKLIVDGKEVHNFKDLRSGKNYEKIAEISPASPLLLEIDIIKER